MQKLLEKSIEKVIKILNPNISSVDSSSFREIVLVADGKKGRVSADKGRGLSRAEEVVKSLSLP